MSTAETLITKYLDTWTSAIKAKSSAGRGGGKKQEFYGIKKLRELILDLAVNGMLVPNKVSDKPVRLKLSGARPDEMGYPANWRCGILGDAFTFEYGDNLPASKRSDTGEYPVYGSNGIVGYHDACLTKTPAIIVGRKGSAGALNIADGPSWTTDVAYFVCPPEDLVLRFTYYLFLTLHLDELGKGIKPGLSRKEAYVLPIALPPLAEQKRIVAKVDELMALCDQLEQQQEDSTRTHTTLVKTLLGALTAASERGAFAEAWQRIASHFDTLFTTESSIDQLKQTILQLAVMGKLVEQDPEDEPAEKLVKRLESNLTLEQKRQSAIPLSPLTQREIPYKVPQCWVWCRFRDVAIIASNLVNPKEYQDYIHLAPDNIEKANGVLLPCRTVKEDKVRSSNHRFYPGQIVYSKIRPNLSKAVVVDFDGLCSADMYPINSLIETNYLHRYMLSKPFLMQAVKSDTRVAMPKINQTELNAIGVPVPPLAEQHRIVAKVDELMALCDRLKARLQSAQATQLHLADSLVKVAIQ
jgi:type I restriction enzyme S subunit